jgi:chitinase
MDKGTVLLTCCLIQPNDKYSWVFKRDYQVSWLNQGSISGSDWWDATKWDYANADYGKNRNGAESIVCAVNIFGQDDVYKYPVHKGSGGNEFNGVCIYNPPPGDRLPANGNFNIRLTYRYCKVDFAPPSSLSGGASKRDWQVTSTFC